MSQLKLGYDAGNPIIINNIANYVLKIQIDNGSIEREFIVRQTISTVGLDRTVYRILSPLKQSQMGIKFHNIECKEGLELVYKKARDTSVCVSLTAEIELVIRGWAEDNRILLGCTVDRISKCYPDDPQEYRKDLYKHYFGDEEDLLPSNDFEFDSFRMLNPCNNRPSICFGIFDNGTQLRISCDFPIHGCGIRSFDTYEETSIITIPLGAVIEGHEHLTPDNITVVLGKNNTVTWINQDHVSHGFVSDSVDSKFWGTGVILLDNASTVKFNQTGIFPYHGDPHPWLTGKIIVLENEN